MSDTDPQAALFEALSKAHAELKNPHKGKTASIKSAKANYSYKYADIADVLDGVRPVLSAHGLALTQPTRVENGWIILESVLTHAGGGSISGSFPVCPITASDKDRGSAMTYSRRYAACSLIGIAADEDVDTGQGDREHAPEPPAQPVETIDTERAALLDNNIKAAGGDLDAILRHFQVASLRELTPKQADAVQKKINAMASKETEAA